MEKFFWTGLALGVIGGALIVSNSYKARQLVRCGGAKIKGEVEKMFEKESGQSGGSDSNGGQAAGKEDKQNNG